MPTDGARVWSTFLKLDAVLAAQPGGHATSDAWRDAIRMFLLSAKRRMVVRKGRQGGGSTTMARLAVAIALGGEHNIAHGTRGEVGFISTKLREANERLFNIDAVFRALGISARRSDDTLELPDRPIIFRSSPCSSRERGMTRIALFEDEMASWRSDDATNPAREVDAASVPSLITQPNARIVSLSSPMGLDDFHAELVARGETPEQLVFEGPSWFWNPSITEAATRELEPHEPTWRREFAAIPQSGSVGALDVDALIACVRELGYGTVATSGPEMVIDASGGRYDTFAAGVFCWVTEPSSASEHRMLDAYDGQGRLVAREATPALDPRGRLIPNPDWSPPAPRLALLAMTSFEGDIASSLGTSDVANALAAFGRRWGVSRAHGDQHGAWTWRTELTKHGIAFEEHAWSTSSKVDAVTRLRELIRSRTLVIAPTLGSEGDKLLAEARSFAETITPSGSLSYGARGRAKDDRVAVLLTACMADVTGRLRGSPVRTPSVRVDWEG